GDKVFHSNYQKNQLLEKLPAWFDGLFRQAELKSKTGQTVILVSKKGKATIKYRRLEEKADNTLGNQLSEHDSETFLHNKKKNYILSEGTPLPFLIDLGVMNKDGMIVKAKSDKFKQINRFLEYIEDILPYLDRNRELTIIDFGCGKSYLTFAMYYYLKILKGYNINVIGLDLKTDVIQHCNHLSQAYGYEKLHFLQGDIASYHGSSAVDMVVTLHACDTATDHALHKAVSWGAKVILSVPCCQHELNAQIHNELLQPVIKYGIIKERLAALFTDALRAELLETQGYRVQLLEFIDMEHTPKNILIRAVKRNSMDSAIEVKEEKLKECIDFLGVSPCLERLFQEDHVGERK
ncbi:MAG TPA: SAM-dependent methyltransferase, partial [Mobilitalea sp.]|nr:SAM-dependent methyltransferase [Mobilitalea sp.]